jgi:hypothetical protein
VKKFLIILAVLTIASFGITGAHAATSALDNIPGGCGVAYWQANAAGFYTLLNIQNVAGNDDLRELGGTVGRAAVAVHITFYNRDSEHRMDFSVPLSPRDNWGAAITGDGADVFITPQPSALAFAGYAPPASWSFNEPGVGFDDLQYGYVTACVTRVDNPAPATLFRTVTPRPLLWPLAGNNNDNPWDDPELSNQRRVLPDFLLMRAAVLSSTSALGFNGNMLQGFLNMPTLSEVIADGWTFITTPGANALCAAGTVDWDNSGLFEPGFVTLDDFGGVDLHAPELYITDNFTPIGGMIVSDGCTNLGYFRAFGAAEELPGRSGIYWARYNVCSDPALCSPTTDSTLLTVAPANSATIFNPARGISEPRGLGYGIFAYNDDEIWASTSIIPPEVALLPLDSPTNPPRVGIDSIDHSDFTSGELRIRAAFPMYGYIQTTIDGVNSDLYPLYKNRVNVETVNILGFDGFPVSDVARIGY